MVLTLFFAKFLGLLLIVLSVSLHLRKKMYMAMLAEYTEKRSSFQPLSIIGLVVGTTLVLMHNVWSGGFLPVLVTVVSWAILIKSIAFLTLSDSVLNRLMAAAEKKRTYSLITLIAILIGAYLFLAGSGGR